MLEGIIFSVLVHQTNHLKYLLYMQQLKNIVVCSRFSITDSKISYLTSIQLEESVVRSKEIEIIHMLFLVIAMYCQNQFKPVSINDSTSHVTSWLGRKPRYMHAVGSNSLELTYTGHALGIWICRCSLFYRKELWVSKSEDFNSAKSLKIWGCKSWCPKDLQICAPAAPVLMHSTLLVLIDFCPV